MHNPASKRKCRKEGAGTKGKKPLPTGTVDFPEVEGKTLKQVAFDTSSEEPTVILVFADDTELCLSIDPRLTVSAQYSAWKSGNQQLLRSWPVIGT